MAPDNLARIRAHIQRCREESLTTREAMEMLGIEYTTAYATGNHYLCVLEYAKELEDKLAAVREKAKSLSYELDGVLTDIDEAGSGFDDVCRETVDRVYGELVTLSKKQKEEPS